MSELVSAARIGRSLGVQIPLPAPKLGISPFVIIGEATRGKTNALKLVLSQVVGKGAAYLFDSKAMEFY